MPSRAPTYFQWAKEKPVTTNQIYGYQMKASMQNQDQPTKPRGPFDYTRPFSSSGFFPQIAADSGSLVLQDAVKGSRRMRSKSVNPLRSVDLTSPGCTSKFNINRGYTMGHVPITEKLQHGPLPPGQKLSRAASAPPAYKYHIPKAKDVYLWHTVSGCLVHCKNRVPDKKRDQYLAY